MYRASTEAVGMSSMAKDFGGDEKISAVVDESAVHTMTRRRGVGKLRHLEKHRRGRSTSLPAVR